MKVDMANFAVSSIRPHLMQQSVEYERKQFQEFLEKQPSMFNVLWYLFVVYVFFILVTVGCCKMIFSKQNENLIWEYVRACKSLQSYPTLCDSMDCSPPGFSVHRILQARILEWVAMPSSRGSSRPIDQTSISYVSCIGRWVLYHWATREAQYGNTVVSFEDRKTRH